MALAVMLLAGAGLLIRSVTRLAAVDPGFRVEPALTFELSLPDSRYEQEPQQVTFFDQLLPRLKSIPGVRSAAGSPPRSLRRRSSLPVANLRTLEQVVSRSISQPRFYMTLLAIFAGVALVLAAVGIFGVLSYAVVQRTREIGIRMALGARERSVVGLVVRHAMVMAVAGVAVGIVSAWVLSTSMMSGLLFSTDPRDAVTFSVVAVTLTVVAL